MDVSTRRMGGCPPDSERPSTQFRFRRSTSHVEPRIFHAASSSTQITDASTTYVDINAKTGPTPASFWYLAANDTIKAKYAFNGVIAFIGESATRYAANTASGATFKRI